LKRKRTIIGSGYLVQCFCWGLLFGIAFALIGFALLGPGGVIGVFGVSLICVGVLAPVFAGQFSGVFLDQTSRQLVGRVFAIPIWHLSVDSIDDITTEPTRKGPALLRLVPPGMWRVVIQLKGDLPSRALPAELGSQLLSRTPDEVLQLIRVQIGIPGSKLH
jgi:hypothetical protein